MRFLADQDVYAITTRFLKGREHDVLTAFEAGLAQAEDVALLAAAQSQRRLLVTRDRDFGSLVFAQGRRAGVIFLRMFPGTANAVHAELQRVLSLYSEEDLRESFVVVEPGRHRIRRPPQ